MDDETIQELGPQQNLLDKRIGRLLVLAVPPSWKQIDLYVSVTWREQDPEVDVAIASPEGHPSGDAVVADELRQIADEYVRLFQRYGLVLAGLTITMRPDERHGWKYGIQYEY